jgi:hypothetical protein
MSRFFSLCLLSCLGLCVLSGCGTSHGSSQSRASMTITCSAVTGSINFDPPLTNKGSASEVVHFDLSSQKCAPSATITPAVTGAAAKGTIRGESGTCAGILISKPVNVAITWTPSSIPPTYLSLRGYGIKNNAQGFEGIALSASRGGSTARGSYVGLDHGATSTALLFTHETVTQILGVCGAPLGLRSLPITSGSFTLR